MINIPNLVVKGRQTLNIEAIEDFDKINRAITFVKSSPYTCAKVNVEFDNSCLSRVKSLFNKHKKVEKRIAVTIATDVIDIYMSGENVSELKSLALMLLNESKTLLRYSSDSVSVLGRISTTETKINRYLNSQVASQCPFEIMRFLKSSLEKTNILELAP